MNSNANLNELKQLKTFIELLSEKNPGLSISLHISFEDFEEIYSKVKYLVNVYKNSRNIFVLKVDSDFDLPFESYENADFSCTSWRNNNLNNYLDESKKEQMKMELPTDFDVIEIEGNPKSYEILERCVDKLSLYVIGGSAKKISYEKGK